MLALESNTKFSYVYYVYACMDAQVQHRIENIMATTHKNTLNKINNNR